MPMPAMDVDGVVQNRQQTLNQIKSFVEDKKQYLNDLTSSVGYSLEELMKKKPHQTCPLNPDHRIPEDKFQKHVQVCRLRTAGYQEDELGPQLQDYDVWYKKWDKILKVEIDENRLNKIVWDHCVQHGQVYTGHRPLPVGPIEENLYLSQDDRVAVYRHVVQTAHEAGKVIPVDKTDELLTTDWGALVKKGLLDDENKEFSSKLEQLAALRDLKRRRQSYRAKNVHITKKSYTEIIREVISNQMEILKPPDEGNKESQEDQQQEQTSRYHNERRERKGGGDRERRGEGDRERRGGGDRERRGQGDRERRGGDRERRGGDRERRGGDRERRGEGDRERRRKRSPDSSRGSEERYSREKTYSKEDRLSREDSCYREETHPTKEESDSREMDLHRGSSKWNTQDSQDYSSVVVKQEPNLDIPVMVKVKKEDEDRGSRKRSRSASGGRGSSGSSSDGGRSSSQHKHKRRKKHKKHKRKH